MYLKETKQTENTFYKDENVYVSQSRLIVSGKTYAVRNISSVSNYRNKKSNSGGIILILLGLFFLFLGVGVAASEGILETIITIIIGAGLTIIGIALKTIWKNKDTFSVQISSNSGESNVLVSADSEYIQKIVDSINEAIIYNS